MATAVYLHEKPRGMEMKSGWMGWSGFALGRQTEKKKIMVTPEQLPLIPAAIIVPASLLLL